MRSLRRAPLLAALLLTTVGAAPAPAAPPPPIKHVFVIVLENESASTTFGPNPPAPYLARTLTAAGAFVPNYYGIGHVSLPNYIGMISGQGPNAQTQSDCQNYTDFTALGVDVAPDQAVGTGCVYPAKVKTIADQLAMKGLPWRGYMQSMGADPTREAATCGHPAIGSSDKTQTATAADQYAARHDPFVYFHSVIDNAASCNANVVGLDRLTQDLGTVATTPAFSFITPDLCADGHDATCANAARPGGYAGIDDFLKTWVPRIAGSPAFQDDGGLLEIVFDEAATSDASACCGETAGPNSPAPGISGLGGGRTGAILLSPYIAPGTVSNTAYNHYSLLRSNEDYFGLGPLGYATGQTPFGSDILGTSPSTVVAPLVRPSAAPATPVIPPGAVVPAPKRKPGCSARALPKPRHGRFARGIVLASVRIKHGARSATLVVRTRRRATLTIRVPGLGATRRSVAGCVSLRIGLRVRHGRLTITARAGHGNELRRMRF